LYLIAGILVSARTARGADFHALGHSAYHIALPAAFEVGRCNNDRSELQAPAAGDPPGQERV